MQELEEHMWKSSPFFGVRGSVWSTFGWEFLGGCEAEESVTQFWSNRGQCPVVELVMTRVNEDGFVEDWQGGGRQKKSWGYF